MPNQPNMNKKIQDKEKKRKIDLLHKVFQNSMTYPSSMVWKQVLDLNIHQWNDIELSIEKTILFIDTYRYNNEFQDYGEFKQYIEIYAVACLPFLIFDGKLINPDIEDRKFHKKTLDWLLYIKQNKLMADHLIHSITSDDSISNIQDDLLDTQIGIYKWFVDNAKKTTKKTNWGGVLQFQYLADSVDRCFCKLDKTKDFLYQFFSEFEGESDSELNQGVIEKSMINKARKNPVINVSKEHIEKVLSLPDNKYSELDIRKKFHLNLAKSLM